MYTFFGVNANSFIDMQNGRLGMYDSSSGTISAISHTLKDQGNAMDNLKGGKL